MVFLTDQSDQSDQTDQSDQMKTIKSRPEPLGSVDQSPGAKSWRSKKESVPMSRRLRVLIVVAVLSLSAVCVAVLIWQQQVHGAALVSGWVALLAGAIATALHLTVSDTALRRHFGEPGAGQMRRLWRRGWVMVLLGVASLGLYYFDRHMQVLVAFDRGQSAATAGDWPKAAAAFSEVIRLDPGSADAYRRRGGAYLSQRDQDRAIADFTESIRLNPTDAGVFYNRGLAFFRKTDYDRALTDFDEAIRLNPSFAIAYLARGMTYGKKGDDAKAKTDRQKAIELDPSLQKPHEKGAA